MPDSDDPLLAEIRRVPIKALAEKAGVSRDTVYRLLNGEPVKESTREAVAAAARALSDLDTAATDSGAADPWEANPALRRQVPPRAYAAAMGYLQTGSFVGTAEVRRSFL